MKQLLVIAIALTAINAQASRARVQALGNSAHLVDTNTVFDNPADVFALPSDYVVLETGATQSTATATGAVPTATTAANANAEGMIVRTMGDAKLGLSLGHQSANASSWGLRSFATNAALEVNQQNPLELTYGMKTGDIGWAGTLVYSNYNDKATTTGVEKENSLGVRLGARAANWDAALRVGLSSNVQLATGEDLKGTTAIALEGGYWMDNMYVYGTYGTSGIKEEGATGTELAKVKNDTISVGVLSSMKKDGSELFYGAQLASGMFKNDTTDLKINTLSLPLIIGLEVDAASWLTFRGSVTQTVIIDNRKVEAAGTTTGEWAPGANTTAVNLGAGLKFNKLTVDGTLGTATTQVVNTTALMAQVGATYWF